MPSVLVVEDDPTVRRAVTRVLADDGYVVGSVGTALDALREITTHPPDAVLLDLGLPDLDGSEALVMIRSVSQVPVIIATARRGEQEIVRLLDAGADDYVTKPFSAAHVLARLRAVLRRTSSSDEGGAKPSVVGPLVVDHSTRSVRLDGRELALTRLEFDLLAFLAERAGRVVSRQDVFVGVWRQPFIQADQTLDAHVSTVRRKLGETGAKPRLLRTVRGVGLMLAEPDGGGTP